MRRCAIALLVACSGDPVALDAAPPRHFDDSSGCDPEADPGRELPDAEFAYDWTCRGAVAPVGEPVGPTSELACPNGTWPDLAIASVCPTVSTRMRMDPASGQMLPPGDARSLPLDLAAQETGSFRIADPGSYPSRIKVVTWNLEYTGSLDAQIATLTTHPALADADVYLFSEVDRCTTRNGMRRGARELARAIGGDYAYAVEFVELDIGREVHGDTGQAIVSRRPLRDVAVACHSSQNDWFADDREPRLGQRVRLAGDVPLGDTFMRVHAIHLESSDVLGEKRVIQSREVLDRAQREACDRPQVIAGDFNAWYCSAPELEVMRRAGFVDAARTVGDAAATHDNGLRLDMVWTRGTRVIEAGVVRGLGLSDHAPVWAVLEPE